MRRSSLASPYLKVQRKACRKHVVASAPSRGRKAILLNTATAKVTNLGPWSLHEIQLEESDDTRSALSCAGKQSLTTIRKIRCPRSYSTSFCSDPPFFAIPSCSEGTTLYDHSWALELLKPGRHVGLERALLRISN